MESAHRHPIQLPLAGESLADFLMRAAKAYGWPERSEKDDLAIIAEMLEPIAEESERLSVGGHLVRALSFAADSSMGLRHLARYVAGQDDPVRELRSLRDNPEHLHFFASLFSFSDYLSEVVIGHPEFLRRVMLGRGLNREKRLDAYQSELAEFLEGFSGEKDRGERLVLFKKRELLRIGIRDLRELADVSELCRELSNLAESIVRVVHADVYTVALQRFGRPQSEENGEEPGFCIYAMGKFGAGELNFSSDIDLVYVYDAEGHTTGVPGPFEGMISRRTTNHEFFNWLGREIARRIGDHTAEGFLYRVDLRLRPEGATGPIARSRASFVQYFASQAGRWEKIAWLKGRCISGDEGLAKRFDPIVANFVFAQNTANELFPDVARLKKRIDLERLSSEGRELDIKRGIGGIREIEFVVAGLQLVHADQHPELRIRGTIDGLQRLVKLGLIDNSEAEQLRLAYYLYRRIEHTLQMMHESQTHRMPTPGLERERLALRCGYSNPEQFEKELSGFRDFVRRTFQRLIEDEGGQGDLQLADYLFGDTEPPAAILEELAPARLNSRTGFAALQRLAVGTSEYAPSVRGQESFRRLLSGLLTELPRVAQPLQAVHQFDLLLRSARGFTWVYDLCLANPLILRLLLRVLGFGSLLGRLLAAHPEWLDEIFSNDGLKESRTSRAIEAFGPERLDANAESALRAIRRFKMLEGFLISLQEVLGICPPEQGAKRMTLLADHVLQLVVALARREVPAPAEGEPRWSLIGLGGLGDYQVHFTGDLDVAVVVEECGACPAGTALNWVDSIIRCVIRDVAGMSPDGQLWKIDARLRPDGASGPLVATDGRFVRYYREEAGLWEWQVLTKARPVLGDLTFGEKLLHDLRCLYKNMGAPKDLGPQILAMKSRIEAQIRLPRTASRDIKRGAGGVIDIEFFAQYWQLAHADRAVELFPLTTNQALEQAAAENWIPLESLELLRSHLQLLRILQRGGRLIFETPNDYFPASAEDIAMLRRALADQIVGNESLFDNLEASCLQVRQLVERLLGVCGNAS